VDEKKELRNAGLVKQATPRPNEIVLQFVGFKGGLKLKRNTKTMTRLQRQEKRKTTGKRVRPAVLWIGKGE